MVLVNATGLSTEFKLLMILLVCANLSELYLWMCQSSSKKIQCLLSAQSWASYPQVYLQTHLVSSWSTVWVEYCLQTTHGVKSASRTVLSACWNCCQPSSPWSPRRRVSCAKLPADSSSIWPTLTVCSVLKCHILITKLCWSCLLTHYLVHCQLLNIELNVKALTMHGGLTDLTLLYYVQQIIHCITHSQIFMEQT